MRGEPSLYKPLDQDPSICTTRQISEIFGERVIHPQISLLIVARGCPYCSKKNVIPHCGKNLEQLSVAIHVLALAHMCHYMGVLKTKTYENEDRRPKMGLRNYENEDPLRKRRPIFVFVLFVFVVRKRRPTTKTKTHLCFHTTKTKTIKYSFICYFRENKCKSVAKNFR